MKTVTARKILIAGAQEMELDNIPLQLYEMPYILISLIPPFLTMNTFCTVTKFIFFSQMFACCQAGEKKLQRH